VQKRGNLGVSYNDLSKDSMNFKNSSALSLPRVWQIFLARSGVFGQDRQGLNIVLTLGNLVMEPMTKMSREEFVVALKQKMEAMLGQVADAINNAPDGYIIPGSEEKVRDLFADLRKQAFETGLQMRIDAAEAAFPPSEAPPDRQEPSQ
jgi:hypothetical protein